MHTNHPITRRRFLAAAAATPVALSAARAFAAPAKRTAADRVPLGVSGVKVSRLGMGTGSNSGQIQRELGQEKFTALLRHGIDRGITFIDTADNYGGMHEMIRPAIKGLDREKIQIQCKIPPNKYDDPLAAIDRFRLEVGTDYFDTMLIHCVRTADWPETQKRLQDLLHEAKEKKIIRAAGNSQHGLLPLRAAAATTWGDVNLVRVNHNGAHMDNLKDQWNEPGAQDEVLRHIRAMHNAGRGIIGMKLIGNGDFKDPDTRRKSIDYVMGLDCVDAVVIGFKSPQEIDEAIANINNALARHNTP